MSAAPRIEAERLSFQPSGPAGPTPVHDLSFRAAPGDLVLVTGPSGAGKTVLLDLIAGLSRFYTAPHASGRLTVTFPDHTNTKHRGGLLPSVSPGRVGYLHQEAGDGLLGVDVVTALAIPLERAGRSATIVRKRIDDALARAGASSLAHREVATLSTGERKRVALAGIDAIDPPLVLLDEPLAGLDPAGVAHVMDLAYRLRERRTVVVAEHRTGFFEPSADTIVAMIPRSEPLDKRAWVPAPDRAHAISRAPAVSLRGVTLHRGARPVLRRASMALGPGVWGLFGPNGAGKSTLLDVIAGLRRPTDGTVTTAGHQIQNRRGHRRSELALRRTVQLALQEPRDSFFASSVAEELVAPLVSLGLAGAARAAGLVSSGLDRFGLAETALRSPLRLSGGEARRLQILGGLLVGPSVWLLDEPTHGLDPTNRAFVARSIAAFAERGGTVLVATHEPSFLPPETSWLFMPGDGTIRSGPKARPGADAPRAAGYTEAEQWDGHAFVGGATP